MLVAARRWPTSIEPQPSHLETSRLRCTLPRARKVASSRTRVDLIPHWATPVAHRPKFTVHRDLGAAPTVAQVRPVADLAVTTR